MNKITRTLGRLVPSAALVLAALVLGAPSPARAQFNPFANYNGPTLSKADLAAGRAAAGRLLGTDPKPVGTAETWTNPVSGNSGTLTVERAYQKKGHECRALSSHVVYKAGSERTTQLQTCRVAGKWKLAS